MSTLYIANCTRQPHDFHYRVPGEDEAAFKRMQTQRIEAGAQQMIHKEAPLPVLEAIVMQHRHYGLVPVDEVVRTKSFVGLCYSFDKPVDVERLSYAADHNLGVLYEQGVQRQANAAVAVDRDYRSQTAEIPGADLQTATEVSYLEDSDNPKAGNALRVIHDTDLARAGGRREGRGI